MKVECQKGNIECVARMGKKSEKIRPIIVTFTTMGKKIELLKNKKILQKSSNYYLKEDFPAEVLEERKKLSAQLQKERDQGKKAYIKYNKLVVVPEKVRTQYERQKRNLSQSPREQKSSTKNPTKKNKIESYFTKNKPINIETDRESPSHQPISKE